MSPPTPPPPPPERPLKRFFSRLGKRVGDIAMEFIGTSVAIAGIALTHLLLKWLIGEEAKFFSVIPVKWVFDAGHVSLIGRLVWRILVPPKDE